MEDSISVVWLAPTGDCMVAALYTNGSAGESGEKGVEGRSFPNRCVQCPDPVGGATLLVSVAAPSAHGVRHEA